MSFVGYPHIFIYLLQIHLKVEDSSSKASQSEGCSNRLERAGATNWWGQLPHNKMLPERVVDERSFGEGFENSIKFILHGLS